jgi:DNA-binding MarR family transcriptional regulator
MDKITVQKYLSETLHQDALIEPWGEQTQMLPPFLLGEFEFYTVKVLNTIFLLLWRKSNDDITPIVLEKRIAAATKQWNGPFCVGQEKITAYTRKRLMEKKIQFIIPGTQLYLPCIGLDLRERFSPVKTVKETLSPSAQLLLLFVLDRKLTECKGKDMAEKLEISQMTVTRAFGELEMHGLCERSGIRRNAEYHFAADGAALWEQAEPHLASPVKKRVWLSKLPAEIPAFTSGLEALAEYTFIASDDMRTTAVSHDTAKLILAAPDVAQLPYQEPGAVQLEIWKYDPAVLASGQTVDQRSLYLCFKDDKDDRTQIELERMKSEW